MGLPAHPQLFILSYFGSDNWTKYDVLSSFLPIAKQSCDKIIGLSKIFPYIDFSDIISYKYRCSLCYFERKLVLCVASYSDCLTANMEE